jgi:poly(hydroxyalkanoate) depolymerase family esterase
MSSLFTRAIAKAADLTRAGNLTEATAVIQRALSQRAEPAAASADGDVIEGAFTRLDDVTPGPRTPKDDRPRQAPAAARTALSETLRRIAAGGMQGGTAPLLSVPPIPAAAQFLSLTYTSPQGTTVYRLYVPANRPDPLMPLILMLHGCTQSPEDFATGTGMNALAEEFGCLVVYPSQTHGANAQKCWNWFRPQDQKRGRGEPALLAGMVQEILRDRGGDPARVYVAGLSAGGAAAAILAAAYPEIFSAAGIHSGLPLGAAQDVGSAFAAMRGGAEKGAEVIPVPTIIFHGQADGTVHPKNGNVLLAQALHGQSGLLETRKSGTSPGGRTFHQTRFMRPDGTSAVELWQVEGAGHAWAGGQAAGSYTDARGPDASREMLRFFLQHHAPSRKV